MTTGSITIPDLCLELLSIYKTVHNYYCLLELRTQYVPENINYSNFYFPVHIGF